MSEQRMIKWYLENQAGLTPEPRMWIDEAEAAIREIVRGWIPKERFLFVGNVEVNKGFNACRRAMIEKVGEK